MKLVNFIHHLKIKKRRRILIWWPLIVFVLVVVALAAWTVWQTPQPNNDMKFGVTFSVKYAAELGLDWQRVYDALINDLQVTLIRLPIYWDELEPIKDSYDWRKFDYMISQAATHGVKLLPVVGRRSPRWPECHTPAWAENQIEAFRQTEILAMVETVIKRYQGSSAIFAWQVDNEPFLSVFGECPPPDRDFLAAEIDLVKKIDPLRPVVVTESGELSTWVSGVSLGDWLGISMYRVTWNQYFGYWYYPLSPNFYKRKAQLIRVLTDKIFISELQAEPWAQDQAISDLSLPEQYKSMNIDRFWKNIDFARRTGMSEAYLWGAEWWYWLKTVHGDASFWQAAQELFSS